MNFPMAFWIITGLLTAIAMGFVCYPLLRKSVSSRTEVDSEQTLYKARLSEIDKDVELGRLDETSAQAARTDEARRLIKATENTRPLKVSSTNKVLVIIAALFLPLSSLPFYLSVGSPHEALPTSVADNSDNEPSIQELLAVAEKRLASNPDDTNGWKVIAPVYMRMGRFDDAMNAYENVLRVEGDSPEFLLKLADAHIEKNQGQVNAKAQQLVSRILELDKENAAAIFYTGIIALQSDNPDETMRIWQAMLDKAKGDEEWIPVIESRIAELKTLENTAVPLPALDEETLEAAQDMSSEDRLEMIGQMVSNLSEKLQEDPDDKQGWQRLITSYMVLDKKEDAQIALANAQKHFSDDSAFMQTLENIIINNSTTLNGENQ
jgi:cytochrome c-type biogenesis protein CcmH